MVLCWYQIWYERKIIRNQRTALFVYSLWVVYYDQMFHWNTGAWKWEILLQKLFQSIVNVVQHTTIIIAPKWPLKQREGACTFAGLKHKMKKNPFSWHDVHSLGESQRRLTNVRWFKESNRITRPNPVFFFWRPIVLFIESFIYFLHYYLQQSFFYFKWMFILAYIRVLRTYLCSNRIVWFDALLNASLPI